MEAALCMARKAPAGQSTGRLGARSKMKMMTPLMMTEERALRVEKSGEMEKRTAASSDTSFPLRGLVSALCFV